MIAELHGWMAPTVQEVMLRVVQGRSQSFDLKMGTRAGRDYGPDRQSWSELEPPALAQHRLRSGSETSIGLVQDETHGKPRRCGDLLAGAHQDAARRPALPRPKWKDHDFAGLSGDLAEKRIDTVGPVDECHGPF